MRIKEKHYYHVGFKRKCNLKEKDLTKTSKMLETDKYVRIGDERGIWIFENKSIAKTYLNKVKEEHNDKTLVFTILDMGTTLPEVTSSVFITE